MPLPGCSTCPRAGVMLAAVYEYSVWSAWSWKYCRRRCRQIGLAGIGWPGGFPLSTHATSSTTESSLHGVARLIMSSIARNIIHAFSNGFYNCLTLSNMSINSGCHPRRTLTVSRVTKYQAHAMRTPQALSERIPSDPQLRQVRAHDCLPNRVG